MYNCIKGGETMSRKKADIFFYNLTRTVMTFLTASSFYILYLVNKIVQSPEYAVRYYHSYPIMLENILASVLIYLVFSLLFIKYAEQSCMR